MSRALALLLAAVSVALLPGVALSSLARAQSAPSVPTSPIPAGEVRDAQARFGALRASPSSEQIAVTRESVSLRCEESADALALCELEVHWTLEASADAETSLYASVVGVEAPRLVSSDTTTDAPSLSPLALHLASGASTEIVLTGRIRLRASQGTTDALDARHLLLATPRTGPHANVLFTRAVERTFARVPGTLEVRADTPDAITMTAMDTPVARGEATVLPPAPLEGRANVPLRFQREGGFPLRHGGPFVALGGTFDRGFRGRVGYELGIDELVIVSVAVDSDFTSDLAAAVLVELATPSFVVPPSLSAGVGFAFRQRLGVLPAGRAARSGGLRLEVGAVFAVVGIVASFDYFPDDAAFTSSLLGRLSI